MKRHVTFASLLLIGTAACGSAQESIHDEQTSQIGQSVHTASAVSFNFVKTADWGTGYNARIDIQNLGPDPILGWEAAFDMPFNVSVNISSLPASAWSVFNTRGIENEIRISQADSSNVINVGQTVSVYLNGSYEGAFAPPTRCRAVHLDTPVACNGSTDLTPPSPPSNVRIFGTGSQLIDIFWAPATDDTGVTGYLIGYLNQGFPAALEIGEVPATAPVTRARITRLVSQLGYSFVITARDAAGNVSASASSPVTVTSAPNISAAFNTVNTWPGGGFQGEFRFTNNESVPLERWRSNFSFTGSFASVWDGTLQGSTPSFSILAPNHNLVLDPGETAIVGATGTFADPATPPANFSFSVGDPAVRPLANPQAPCLGVVCPGGTQCVVLPNGIPSCG